MNQSNRLIFHVDMDAFFASIEQLEHPEYRGKPLIVAGLGARGVVCAASYEAREFGVHSAMPTSQAHQKCPHGIYIHPQHSLYSDYSAKIMDCFTEFSPLIEQISVDEAFLDMTGTGGLFGDAPQAALRLKSYIVEKTGLIASVGIAPNKFLAKLASEAGKPNGLTWIKTGSQREFLDPLSVGKLWGVGKKNVSALQSLGIYSVKQLRMYPEPDLCSHFGDVYGRHLRSLAEGEDQREIKNEWREKSISNEVTFERDSSHKAANLTLLLELSDRVARRARKEGLSGRTISLVWRDPNFSRHSRSETVPEPSNNSGVIYDIVRRFYCEMAVLPGSAPEVKTDGKNTRKFRLLGVRLSNFESVVQQMNLFTSPENNKLDRALDAVKNRFGDAAISRAALLRKQIGENLQRENKRQEN